MTRDIVEMIRGAFERWAAGDREPREDEIHPEFEIITRSSMFRGEPYRGADGMRQWVADMEASFDEWQLNPRDFRRIGDVVLVTGDWRLRGRESGVILESEIGWTFEFEGDRARRMRVFDDPAEAERWVTELVGEAGSPEREAGSPER